MLRGSQNWCGWSRRHWLPRDVTSAAVVLNLNARSDEMTLISSTHISVWKDQSGGGRDGSQGTDGNRPIYSANGGPGGRPCVTFSATANGSTGQWIAWGNVFSSLTSAEVFIVRKAASDPASPFPDEGAIWHFGTNVNGDLAPFSDGNVYDAFGSTARKPTGDPTTSLASWHIYNVTSVSGEWTSRINGVQHFTTATNTVGFDTSALLGKTLGALGSSSMTTIWIFDAKLSTTDRASVTQYLAFDNGISI